MQLDDPKSYNPIYQGCRHSTRWRSQLSTIRFSSSDSYEEVIIATLGPIEIDYSYAKVRIFKKSTAKRSATVVAIDGKGNLNTPKFILSNNKLLKI